MALNEYKKIISIIIVGCIISLNLSYTINAQSTNYVNYINISNNDFVWLYNNELVVYQKDPNVGLVKIYGPTSFQTITKSYLLANTPHQTDLVPLDQAQWANDWAAIVDDLNNWMFVDKYAIYATILEYRRNGDNYNSIFHYLIKVDLTTQNIELYRSCSICNSTRWGGGMLYRQQLVDGMLVVYYIIDEDAAPDIWYAFMKKITSSTTIWHDNYSGPSNYLFTSDGISIFKVISTYSNGLIGFRYNSCVSLWAPNYKIIRFDGATIYDSNGGCSQGNNEPTFASLTQLGRSGSSIFVSQTLNNQTYYYKCELVNANDVINSFSNCIDVDSNDAFSNNILVSNPTLRTDQALSQNLPYPSLLFKNNTTFYKSKWFLSIDSTKIYAQGPNTILSTNTNYVIRNLFAERPGAITNDANKLGGVWKLRVVDSTDPNNIQTAEYDISGMFLSNTLELNTLLTYFNPSNSSTIDVYLVWQITYNNEVKERVFNLKFSKETSVNIASIDISDSSITLADLTVVFTDNSLANTNMFIKLQGFDVFVDMKKTSPDRIKFFTVEGNCYQIYKLNQTFTWLGTICSSPPYTFTIGPSNGQEGGILLPVYWHPNWYTTHKLYTDTDIVDIILHKTNLPIKANISIKDKNNNIFIDDTFTSNVDPTTKTYQLDSNLYPYKLVVTGYEGNKTFVAYTAIIDKNPSTPFGQVFNSIPSSYGLTIPLLVVLLTMTMWSRNSASIGVALTVVMIATLNYLNIIKLNDTAMLLLFVIAGVAILLTKKLF